MQQQNQSIPKKMKWARKKSSLYTSLITPPLSWLSKFKQRRGSSEANSRPRMSSEVHLSTPPSKSLPGGLYYNMDEDDVYWRISFTRESPIQPHHCPNFDDMVRKMKERQMKHKDGSVRGVKESDNCALQNQGYPNKLKEIKIRPDRLPKARQNGKRTRAYSPRTECKIRALEEMKKLRSKVKKEASKGTMLELDSLAVVKSSFDPQQDFRESMVEMIRAKGIRRGEELEQLLTCYLTLNCDSYHHLIIKVFRQVCSQLNGIHNTCHCGY